MNPIKISEGEMITLETQNDETTILKSVLKKLGTIM
jgi:hypothetical protein